MFLEIGTDRIKRWVELLEGAPGEGSGTTVVPLQDGPHDGKLRLLFFPSQSKQSSSYSDRDTTEEESESLDDMDFLTRQKKLQAEAKMALAMAKPMAKMQVEVEKQNRKKSPVADLVSSKRRSASECLVTTNGWRCPSPWPELCKPGFLQGSL